MASDGQERVAGTFRVDRAAREPLEDCVLRFTPRSYRKWSPSVVGGSALGGMAYLADFSIGAGIGLLYGSANAVAAILLAALIIFSTGLPRAYYAARSNIDLDLVTRGMVAFLAASMISIMIYFGAFGAGIQPYSPLAAVLIAFVLTPLMAIATGGRFYLRRQSDGIEESRLDAQGNPSASRYDCVVCKESFEHPDAIASRQGGVICSLCLATDRSGQHLLPAQPKRLSEAQTPIPTK